MNKAKTDKPQLVGFCIQIKKVLDKSQIPYGKAEP